MNRKNVLDMQCNMEKCSSKYVHVLCLKYLSSRYYIGYCDIRRSYSTCNICHQKLSSSYLGEQLMKWNILIDRSLVELKKCQLENDMKRKKSGSRRTYYIYVLYIYTPHTDDDGIKKLTNESNNNCSIVEYT